MENVPVPNPAFFSAALVVIVSAAIVIVARRYDPTEGLLTISILVVAAFITAAFASMIYDVKQTPSTELLLGALATSLGAIVAHWMSPRK